MAEKNEYVEQIKHEWRKCAKFIRGTYSFSYPSHFDAHFEGDMDKHLKFMIANRGVTGGKIIKPKKSAISDRPFNKIAEMIGVVTSPKSEARRGMLAELLTIKDQLRLIEDEKKEAEKNG